jgi:hypothetical protein
MPNPVSSRGIISAELPFGTPWTSLGYMMDMRLLPIQEHRIMYPQAYHFENTPLVVQLLG